MNFHTVFTFKLVIKHLNLLLFDSECLLFLNKSPHEPLMTTIKRLFTNARIAKCKPSFSTLKHSWFQFKSISFICVNYSSSVFLCVSSTEAICYGTKHELDSCHLQEGVRHNTQVAWVWKVIGWFCTKLPFIFRLFIVTNVTQRGFKGTLSDSTEFLLFNTFWKISICCLLIKRLQHAALFPIASSARCFFPSSNAMSKNKNNFPEENKLGSKTFIV